MRKIITTHLGLAILISGLLGACTPEQIASNEARAKAVLVQINAGLKVSVAAAKDAVDAVCENQIAAANAAAVVRAGLSTQFGLKTTQNLNNLDTALATMSAACAQASANPNDPAMKSLLKSAMAAYQVVKAAQAKTGASS